MKLFERDEPLSKGLCDVNERVLRKSAQASLTSDKTTNRSYIDGQPGLEQVASLIHYSLQADDSLTPEQRSDMEAGAEIALSALGRYVPLLTVYRLIAKQRGRDLDTMLDVNDAVVSLTTGELEAIALMADLQ